jgi:hypothetical protein
MEEKPASTNPAADEKKREAEARKKLARPPKDKTEVIIGPTDRSGPDVVIG